ncbi:hypothetical protein RCL1_006728 [Eukaryota sp. TZLM3-RCL]
MDGTPLYDATLKSPSGTPPKECVTRLPFISPFSSRSLIQSPRFSPRCSKHLRSNSFKKLFSPLMSPPVKRVHSSYEFFDITPAKLFDSSTLVPISPPESRDALEYDLPTQYEVASSQELVSSPPPALSSSSQSPDIEVDLSFLNNYCLSTTEGVFKLIYDFDDENMDIIETNHSEILAEFFEFPGFRSQQLETIQNILSKVSTLLILPTGAGKTLPLYYSSLFLKLLGPIIVISPLNALINDQITSLPTCLKGCVVPRLSGSIKNDSLVNKLVSNDIIWMSPEKANSLKFQEIWAIVSQRRREIIVSSINKLRKLKKFAFLHDFFNNCENFVMNFSAALVVIDEAHCISTWSMNFRPDFLRIPKFIDSLGNPTVLALTATCSMALRSKFKNDLGIKSILTVDDATQSQEFNRILITVSVEHDRESALIELLSRPDFSGNVIVFVLFQEQALALSEAVSNTKSLSKLTVSPYHGSLSAHQREGIELKFRQGLIDVLIATCAYGMGIDTRHVSHVIHYSIPRSPEEFLQQVGRAGRSRKVKQIRPRSHVFLSVDDVLLLASFVNSSDVCQYSIIEMLKFFRTRAQYLDGAWTVDFDVVKISKEYDMSIEILNTIFARLEISDKIKCVGNTGTKRNFQVKFSKLEVETLAGDIFKIFNDFNKNSLDALAYLYKTLNDVAFENLSQIFDKRNSEMVRQRSETLQQLLSNFFFSSDLDFNTILPFHEINSPELIQNIKKITSAETKTSKKMQKYSLFQPPAKGAVAVTKILFGIDSPLIEPSYFKSPRYWKSMQFCNYHRVKQIAKETLDELVVESHHRRSSSNLKDPFDF